MPLSRAHNMLLALLLAACVAPAAHEWVEISQQHYRKPSLNQAHPTTGTFYPADEKTSDHVRHTSNPPNEATIPNSAHINSQDQQNYEEQLQLKIPHTVYRNQSISEQSWNNYRASNIKRVVGNAKIRPNVTPEFSIEIYGEVTESAPELGTKSRLQDQEAATVRVSNKGKVKRVQLSNTPVKSPHVTHRRHDIRPGSTVKDNEFSDEFEIEADIFKNVQDKTVTPLNQETTMWKYDRIDTSTSDPTMVSNAHPFDNIKQNNDIARNRKNITTNVVKVKLEQSVKHDEEVEMPNSAMKNKKVNKQEDIELGEVTTKVDTESNVPKGQKPKPTIKTSSNGDKNRKKEIKVNMMENVMKFVKVIAETISKNTKGVNGKVKYLNQLKDTLLSNIKERVEATWPDDAGRAARWSRSPRGHVEFPSSESSLMTISFLTFAVFLIKLVLQVIQTYKNKTMMVAPLVVATAGRALSGLRKRNLQ